MGNFTVILRECLVCLPLCWSHSVHSTLIQDTDSSSSLWLPPRLSSLSAFPGTTTMQTWFRGMECAAPVLSSLYRGFEQTHAHWVFAPGEGQLILYKRRKVLQLLLWQPYRCKMTPETCHLNASLAGSRSNAQYFSIGFFAAERFCLPLSLSGFISSLNGNCRSSFSSLIAEIFPTFVHSLHLVTECSYSPRKRALQLSLPKWAELIRPFNEINNGYGNKVWEDLKAGTKGSYGVMEETLYSFFSHYHIKRSSLLCRVSSINYLHECCRMRLPCHSIMHCEHF